MTPQPIWLVIAVPAVGLGYVLGNLLNDRWEGQPEKARRAFRGSVAVGLAALLVAYVNVFPLIANGIAVLAATVALRIRATARRAASET